MCTIELVLDFDGTLTLEDTTSVLATLVHKSNFLSSNSCDSHFETRWKQFEADYFRDYKDHFEGCFRVAEEELTMKKTKDVQRQPQQVFDEFFEALARFDRTKAEETSKIRILEGIDYRIMESSIINHGK
eukprot:TRINITY_DN4456_c0_g2_i1.p1 TRINITY_DN4456_c0_g2~~TRINITY_DN4456_c0_g2_i1.p1  ORF type:complete len:130 (+),score=38.40 TRINITY_DN4456_c0_g2_i1:46-435(+)